ncbi:MAG: endonuclease/exonuclease/phosphatase family protein [Minisyncoccota bacterium]
MKLITLNTWGARIRKPFLDFIINNQDVDIFCFQELYDEAEPVLGAHYPKAHFNLFSDIKKLLPNHNGFFRPVLEGVYGIGIFVKKNIEITGEGETSVHIDQRTNKKSLISGHHDRSLQWIEIKTNNKVYSILNVHGLWNGKGKTDTPDRLAQSQKIKGFMNTIHAPKILCGDFNLRPDTESIKMLEQDMNNLIKTFGVETTRTSFYTKPEKHADYIFTSPEIKINHFEVMSDEVSDHSPLLLNFS